MKTPLAILLAVLAISSQAENTNQWFKAEILAVELVQPARAVIYTTNTGLVSVWIDRVPTPVYASEKMAREAECSLAEKSKVLPADGVLLSLAGCRFRRQEAALNWFRFTDQTNGVVPVVDCKPATRTNSVAVTESSR